MTPFQGFRLWTRRAPLGERVVAAVSAVVVLALLGWVLRPSGPVTGAATGFSTSADAPPTAQAPAQRGATGKHGRAASGPGAPASVSGPGGPAATGPAAAGSATPGISTSGGEVPTSPTDPGECVSPPGSATGV